jgi:hypothetical protein
MPFVETLINATAGHKILSFMDSNAGYNQIFMASEDIHKTALWQNRLNYSGSSALVIAIQLILTQRTSNGTTHWSVGSPPDATTVQQDRSRFTSHEGEFTIAQ